MSSLTDIDTQEKIIVRLKLLNEHSEARWGKMSVTEMLAHMNDAIRIALGMKNANDTSNFISNKIVFPVAVYMLPFWPKATRLHPS